MIKAPASTVGGVTYRESHAYNGLSQIYRYVQTLKHYGKM